jgi:hypothetical protein
MGFPAVVNFGWVLSSRDSRRPRKGEDAASAGAWDRSLASPKSFVVGGPARRGGKNHPKRLHAMARGSPSSITAGTQLGMRHPMAIPWMQRQASECRGEVGG